MPFQCLLMSEGMCIPRAAVQLNSVGCTTKLSLVREVLPLLHHVRLSCNRCASSMTSCVMTIVQGRLCTTGPGRRCCPSLHLAGSGPLCAKPPLTSCKKSHPRKTSRWVPLHCSLSCWSVFSHMVLRQQALLSITDMAMPLAWPYICHDSCLMLLIMPEQCCLCPWALDVSCLCPYPFP